MRYIPISIISTVKSLYTLMVLIIYKIYPVGSCKNLKGDYSLYVSLFGSMLPSSKINVSLEVSNFFGFMLIKSKNLLCTYTYMYLQ